VKRTTSQAHQTFLLFYTCEKMMTNKTTICRHFGVFLQVWKNDNKQLYYSSSLWG
jgi:hypothetical protein